MKTLKIFGLLFSLLITANITVLGQGITKSPPVTSKFVGGVYRVSVEKVDGKTIWIVDGAVVRREIFPEFLYGGNGERYLFVPKDEIWIDQSIAAEEFQYTLSHELHERDLMAQKGMSYADAHDSSLALEQKMRKNDLAEAQKHEQSLPRVSPTDCDNLKEISSLPDSIKLKNIYRVLIGKRDGIEVWIVDGAAVRRDIFPDFGLSGNDLAYKFIPRNEIWIDAQISCEETELSIISELKERQLMAKGIDYDSAYEQALKIVEQKRNLASKFVALHKPLEVPQNLVRDVGTGSEKK
jgi:hypothetical protein